MDVLELVRKYGTANPFELADSLGIKYYFVDLPQALFGKMITDIDNEPIILINVDLSDSLFRYTVMAHELLHALEHVDLPNYYSFAYHGKGKLEHEADLFTSKLMTIFYHEQYGELPETYYSVCTTFGVKEEFEEYVKVSEEAFYKG